MNIYKISRVDSVGYDEWSAFVIAANSADECKRMVEVGPILPWADENYSNAYNGIPGVWGEPELIGYSIMAQEQPFVILDSFNAG